MELAWSSGSLSTPSFSAILCDFLVLVPVDCIPAAATRARPARWQSPVASSGKKLPRLSLGILGVRVPAQASSLLYL